MSFATERWQRGSLPVITWRVLGGRHDLCTLFALTVKKAHAACEAREPKGSPDQGRSKRNLAATHGRETQS